MNTPIADMVAEMLKNCIPNETIILAVRTIELVMQGCTPTVDAAAEKRRAWDRKRRSLLPNNWVEVTQAVFERDGYACVYCGDDSDVLHCDHIHPLSRGGSSEMENLNTACRACNLGKGSKLLSEWKYYQMGGCS